MKEILIALLKALGIDQKKIDAVLAIKDEDAKNFKPDEIVTDVTTGMKTALENDAEFLGKIPEDKINKDILKKLESGQYTRFQKELIEVAVQKLGLDEKVVFTDEDKKSIKALAQKMAMEYLKKNNNTAGLEKMQKDLADATDLLTKKDEEFKNQLTEKEKSINTEWGTKYIKSLTKIALGSLDKVKLTTNPDYIVDPILKKIAEKHGAVLEVGADDVIRLKQKANNALHVVGKDNKEITFAQALREVVLEDKVGVEEKPESEEEKRKKLLINSGGEGGKDGVEEIPDYIKDKIAANPAPEEAK